MNLRIASGWGIVVAVLLLGLSCSGPKSDATRTRTPDRVYHVQLHMTKDKTEANRMLGRALDWWRQKPDTLSAKPLVSSGESPVFVMWRAPLYRVRLGPFSSRSKAEHVLEVMHSSFPDAFVAPERLSSRPTSGN